MNDKKVEYWVNMSILVTCPDMDTACDLMKKLNAVSDEAVEKFPGCHREYDSEYQHIQKKLYCFNGCDVEDV